MHYPKSGSNVTSSVTSPSSHWRSNCSLFCIPREPYKLVLDKISILRYGSVFTWVIWGLEPHPLFLVVVIFTYHNAFLIWNPWTLESYYIKYRVPNAEVAMCNPLHNHFCRETCDYSHRLSCMEHINSLTSAKIGLLISELYGFRSDGKYLLESLKRT